METIDETALRNQAPLPNQGCEARVIHAVNGRLPKGHDFSDSGNEKSMAYGRKGPLLIIVIIDA
jgi:hypothetical protein